MINLPGPAFLSDQNGNYCTGQAGVLPSATTITGATTTQTGAMIAAGLGPTGLVTPLALDTQGALSTKQLAWQTIAYVVPGYVSTTTTAGKSMLSVYNAGTNYFRLFGLHATCPPQTNISGALTAVTSSYNAIPFSSYFFSTAHTGGTLVGGVSHDARDTFDANFTCRTGATIAGQAANPVFYWDAAQPSIVPSPSRTDQNAKLIVIPPGTGLTFNCVLAMPTAISFILASAFSQSTT